MALASVVCFEYVLAYVLVFFFFFQAEDGIRDRNVTGVQTCALPISLAGLGGNNGGVPAGAGGRRAEGEQALECQRVCLPFGSRGTWTRQGRFSAHHVPVTPCAVCPGGGDSGRQRRTHGPRLARA